MTNNLVASDHINNINANQIMFQYQKNNLIGKGTFGKVYTALDQRTGGLLAVKCIKLSDKTDPE